MYVDRRRYWGNSPVNCVAMLILEVIIIEMMFAFYGIATKSPSNDIVVNLITEFVAVIPFGGKIGEIVFGTAASVLDFDVMLMDPDLTNLTVPRILCEILKLSVASAVFVGLAEFLKTVLGFKDRLGFWNRIQEALLDFFSAFLAGFGATLICDFFTDQIKNMPTIIQYIMPSVLLILTIGGTFAIVLLVSTITSMAKFILGFIIKYILMDSVKLLCTYACMMFLLAGAYEGNFIKCIYGCGGIIVIFIVLAGIDLALKPVFDF